jgi:coenzyme F420-reducing hydrogenase delta subunit/Pyruvate/2-oxoacid:ferredoxin oxidoreductase delta subunit
VLRLLTTADAAVSRWYGWRYNPLFQSGTIVVALLATLLATGIWLLLFYRVGAPYESVANITANPWIGNWVRGLHRYATDAAMVATVVHAVRMFAQARTWGARTLAWMSGSLLALLLMACGWTGYVLVWDTFGEYLARDGARMIDTLPVLSEPISRAFTGERPVPSVFFFLTLFAHIGIPLGMAVVFWLHIKRLARPALLPPRPLMWTTIGLLAGIAIVRPLVMAPKADPFVLPAEIPVDLFMAFWLPVTERLGGGAALGLLAAAFGALVMVPALTRRRGAAKPLPSTVDEAICTGCTQCSIDCPYGAIEMISRTDGRPTLVARVESDLCVSCGICAGSCAPMGVGPPGRTGRDQIGHVHAFLEAPGRRLGEVVVIACDHGAGTCARAVTDEGAALYPISCAGNLHSSVIELLIRGGAGGVLVLGCPPRDCWHREGPRWLTERVYHEREAELQARVPRERVRIAHAGAHDPGTAAAAVRAFIADVAALGASSAERKPEPDTTCDPVELPVESRSRA